MSISWDKHGTISSTTFSLQNEPNFSSPNLNVESQPLLKLINCAVCSAECYELANQEIPGDNIDDSTFGRNEQPTLETLCNVFNVTNLCENIGKDREKGRDLSQVKQVFCSFCSEQVQEAVRLRKDIRLLDEKLEEILTNLRSYIKSSHERQEKKETYGESDLESFVHKLRHSLCQCWAPVEVQLSDVHRSRKRISRKSEIVTWTKSILQTPLYGEEDTRVKTEVVGDKYVDEPRINQDNLDPAYVVSAGQDSAQNATEEVCEKEEENWYSQENKDTVATLQCNLCPKKYNREANLKIHQNKTHGVPSSQNQHWPRKCQHCGKMFAEVQTNSNSENSERIFKCEVAGCRKNSTSFKHVEYHHQRTCTKMDRECRRKKDFVSRCDPCGKTFHTATAYRNHQLSVHEQKFQHYCEICGHGTQAKSMLIRHMLVHSNEKTIQCDECEYRCKRPSQLMYHKRIHRNDYPHLCQVCGKSFRLNNKLQQHMATHSSSKEFKCPLCNKFFASKTYVANHVNLSHKRKSAASKKGINLKTPANKIDPVVNSFNTVLTGQTITQEEVTECEQTEFETTTIILHITEDYVENISESHTTLEI